MIDPGIDAVFFDAVGTLLHPRQPVHRTYADVGRRYGSTLDEHEVRIAFKEAFAREELKDELADWRTDEEREHSRWRTIVREALPDSDPERTFAELWSWFSRPEAWTVHPDAAKVLNQLASRNLIVGIASNFDARLTGLVNCLPELTLVRDHCIISSLVGWRKPARGFFAAVIAAANCEPNRVLFVGDDERNDVQGALSAGLQAVLFDPESQSKYSSQIYHLRDLPRLAGVTTG